MNSRGLEESTKLNKKYEKITKEIGFSYFTVGLQILFAPILIALLTRVLKPEVFGVYSLFSITVLLSISFLELGLTQYIVIKLSGVKENERIRSFFSILGFELLLLIFFSAGFMLFSKHFLRLLELQDYWLEFNICILIIIFGVISRMFFSYFKAKQRLNLVNFLYMVRSKGWSLLLVAFFLLFGGFVLFNVFAIWIIGSLLVVLVYLIYARKDIVKFFKLKMSTPLVRKALVYGVPLIPVIIASWLISASDKYILNYFERTAIVGIYTLGYSLFGTVTTLGATASQVIQPYFAEAWNLKGKYNVLINASLKYGFIIILPAVTGLAFFSQETITLLSGAEYLSATLVMPILAFFPIFAFLGFICYEVLIAANRTKFVGLVFVIGALINIILNWFLIPVYGMQGAAVATVTAYLFMAIGLGIPSRKYIKLNHSFLRIPQMIAASLVMGIPVYFLSPTTAILKIVVVLVFACFYFALLFVFRVFDKKEIAVVKSLLHIA